MPILLDDYEPSFLFRNCHLNTIFPSQCRKPPLPDYTRTRIDTVDNDFFDIDSILKDSKNAIIVCHGLEGSSKAPYVRGMIRALSPLNTDIHVFNFRTCSGELNRLPSAYNAAITEDLNTLVNYLAPKYDKIFLVGFSLSANLILNYLGKNKECITEIPPQVKAAVAVSSPIDMVTSANALNRKTNFVYEKRFVLKLKRKISAKMKFFDNIMDKKEFKQIKTLRQFDDLYTSKMCGYKDANEYYEKSSAKQHLHKVMVPTLIITAIDDPILSPECIPYKECQENENLSLIATKYGGHVGFYLSGQNYYHENKAKDFFAKYL